MDADTADEKKIPLHKNSKPASSDESFANGVSEPGPRLPEEESAWSAYKRVFRYAGAVEYSLQAIGVVAAIASGAGIALQNLIFGKFITSITNFVGGQSSPSEFRDDSADLALYFVYLGIARFVLAYLYNSLFTYAGYRIVRNIRHEYVRSALSQEVAFYDFGIGGSIATQATSNGRLIQGGISEKLGLTFQGLAAFVTAFIVAFVVHWKLTLICLCIAPATMLVTGVVAGIEAGHETKILDIHAQANSFAEGVLSSTRTVHAFEMRARLVAIFDKYLVDAHKVGRKISPLFGLMFSTEYTIIYLGFGLAFWQGVRLLADGDVGSSGDIFTVLFSVVIAAISLTALAPYSIDFSRAASAAAKLFRLIDRRSAIDPFQERGEEPPTTVGFVELDNVTFAYPTRPSATVLNDFTLRIPTGKVTALVGKSGCGKSTIIGLIERWYNPNSGTIRVDGRPIAELNLHWLRKNVRLVQQEPVLFQGTVFENIRHGLSGTLWENAEREEQMARVQEAAKIAFAHDFIMELPNGYETQIGQRGGTLSGGQKQRIAIARSVISQPKILLLDEATSALDPRAEGIVQSALDRASEGRTTIVIAHKLATIRKADNIVVMSEGRVVEQGTHESLIAADGTYARLVRIQDLDVSAGGSIQSTFDGGGGGAADEAGAANLTQSLTRVSTAAAGHVENLRDRDDYENHKSLGFLHVVFRLVKETPELGWSYFVVVVACLGGAAMFPGQAILLAKVMDVFKLTGSAMVDRGNFYASMFIVLSAGCLVSYFALGYSTNTVAQQLNHKFRRQILDDMLRQDLQFFDRTENNTGALASRLDSNPQSILELMGFNIALILVSTLNVLACSVLAISYSWNLGLVVVCAGLPPMLVAGYLKIRFDAKLDNETSKRYAASASIVSEAVTAIRTVSSLAIEEAVLTSYTIELDSAIARSTIPMLGVMTFFALTQGIEYWFMALGFWYGCRLLSFGEVEMYDFFVAFLGVFFSGQAASQFFQFSTSITKGMNAANYIFWLHGLEPTIQENPVNRDKGPKSGGPIALDHVRFSYPLRPNVPVLKGLSLTVTNGQFLALVGASGCGKSTIVAMLERFYDPTRGSISIDSSPVTDLNPRHYRRIIGLVQQEPTLFQGTIRENVALGIDDGPQATSSSNSNTSSCSDAVPTTSVDQDGAIIESALRAANAWDFVSSLPEGTATQAGPAGTQLSGGQRQRIAIARALVRNPAVLLLDEATSALDTESEKLVQRALARAAREGRDRIMVAVAHRLSTIKDADAICVFYGGRIAEMGTHAELISQRGIYYKMCEAQALD